MSLSSRCVFLFFFFNDTATTEIYTLSLHDALPIFLHSCHEFRRFGELSYFRRQLLHRQARVGGVQHRPDHAAAVRFVDQWVESVVAQQSFLTPKAHLDHLFQNGAMAKRRGIRIDEKEEQIVRPRTGAERIQRVTPRFEGGELLLFEESFRRIWIVSPERHADDLFSAG